MINGIQNKLPIPVHIPPVIGALCFNKFNPIIINAIPNKPERILANNKKVTNI
jgi:hypothetical protein